MSKEASPRSSGKECVWDYPRPPRMEPTSKHIHVEFARVILADTRSAFRVLETSHPPVYYVPPSDVNMTYLVENPGTSYCEWKVFAGYYGIEVGDVRLEKTAWFYADPAAAFEPIRDHIAFYPEPSCVQEHSALKASQLQRSGIASQF